MPHTDDTDTETLSYHVEAAILAQPRLVLKLRHVSKFSNESDHLNIQLVSLLAKHLIKEGTRLGRVAARLEKHFMEAVRKRTH
ncbi:MAG: hypothetical protein WCO61_01130 [Alphaproteobacteria bacterium]